MNPEEKFLIKSKMDTKKKRKKEKMKVFVLRKFIVLIVISIEYGNSLTR